MFTVYDDYVCQAYDVQQFEWIRTTTSQARPPTCRNTSSKGLHRLRKSWNTLQEEWNLNLQQEDRWTFMQLHASPSNISKWQLNDTVEYEATSSSRLINNEIPKYTEEEASDHCIACVSIVLTAFYEC